MRRAYGSICLPYFSQLGIHGSIHSRAHSNGVVDSTRTLANSAKLSPASYVLSVRYIEEQMRIRRTTSGTPASVRERGHTFARQDSRSTIMHIYACMLPFCGSSSAPGALLWLQNGQQNLRRVSLWLVRRRECMVAAPMRHWRRVASPRPRELSSTSIRVHITSVFFRHND